MRTREARIQLMQREELYPSDVTDEERSIITPMIPPERRDGRHRETAMRPCAELFSAVMGPYRG
jgi:hypothetical protein